MDWDCRHFCGITEVKACLWTYQWRSLMMISEHNASNQINTDCLHCLHLSLSIFCLSFLFMNLNLSLSHISEPSSLYLNSSIFYSLFTDLQDWREVQSSRIFPWSVYHPMRRLGRVNHLSALHIPTSAPTWNTTYALYTAAPPSLWSQRHEDWALLKVRFTPRTSIRYTL